MGSTYHLRLAELTGHSVEDITAAFIVARDILQTHSVIEQIQSLDNKIDAYLQMHCLTDISTTLDAAMLWLLRHLSHPMDIQAAVTGYSRSYNKLLKEIGKSQGPLSSSGLQQYFDNLKSNGVPDSLAKDLTVRMSIVNALDIINISLNSRQSLGQVAEVYFGVENILGLDWLQNQISGLQVKNNWHERSRFSLAGDLRSHQTGISSNIVSIKGKASAAKKLEVWMESNAQLIENLELMIKHLKEEVSPDFSMLSVVVSELGRLK
jgi:glutamate dehydrogenase